MSDTGPEPRDARTPDDATDAGRAPGATPDPAAEPTPIGTPAGTPADAAAEERLVARVRADDPAADAVPDAPALRAAVQERLAGTPAGTPARTVDELAARRARRRGWVPVAAAVAGALVIGGGGGYAIGAAGDPATSGGADSAVLAQAPAAGGAERSAPRPQEASGATAGAAATDSAKMAYGGWGGRTVFTAQGLSDQGGTATVWALDAATAYSAERLAAVAAALGVPGEVSDQNGFLLVGPNDGSGPSVSMSPDGSGSVSYYDPAKDPWTCAATPDTKDGDPCTQRDLGPAPSAADAEAQLRALLAAAGLDADAYAYDSQSSGDPAWTYVSAVLQVDGQRTDVQWTASWTGAGLQSVYGSIAPLVSLGEYAVVSPAEAVTRLGDPRFGAVNGPVLYAADGARAEGGAALEDAPAVSSPAEPAAPTVPATPTAGSPLAWPVSQVTIVSATLALGTQYLPSGAMVLAPTYTLTGDDGSTWQVLAVADSALDFAVG